YNEATKVGRKRGEKNTHEAECLRKQMSILPVLKVKMESRCNLLTTILYDSFLSFSMMVKDIGPVRVLRRLKVLTAH
ncbi:hypothetical protein ABG864_18305, partial [Phocaeicola vulgatus]